MTLCAQIYCPVSHPDFNDFGVHYLPIAVADVAAKCWKTFSSCLPLNQNSKAVNSKGN